MELEQFCISLRGIPEHEVSHVLFLLFTRFNVRSVCIRKRGGGS